MQREGGTRWGKGGASLERGGTGNGTYYSISSPPCRAWKPDMVLTGLCLQVEQVETGLASLQSLRLSLGQGEKVPFSQGDPSNCHHSCKKQQCPFWHHLV